MPRVRYSPLELHHKWRYVYLCVWVCICVCAWWTYISLSSFIIQFFKMVTSISASAKSFSWLTICTFYNVYFLIQLLQAQVQSQAASNALANAQLMGTASHNAGNQVISTSTIVNPQTLTPTASTIQLSQITQSAVQSAINHSLGGATTTTVSVQQPVTTTSEDGSQAVAVTPNINQLLPSELKKLLLYSQISWGFYSGIVYQTVGMLITSVTHCRERNRSSK